MRSPPPGYGPASRPPGLHVTALASSSTGNCVVVGLGEELLLVDAGLSWKRTRALLETAGLDRTVSTA